MRKTIYFILILFCSVLNVSAKDIIVENTLFGIENALQQAREARRLEGVTDVNIILKEGIYRVCQQVVIRPEDSGTRIIADGKAVVSGGVLISGWKKEGRYFVADQPFFNGRPLEFRQLWVNGVKAVRARDVEDFEQMHRIMAMDKAKEVLYVPTAAVKSVLKGKKTLDNIEGLEMTLHEMWCVANLRIKRIDNLGDSAAVYFHNPESYIHFKHPWPSPMITKDGHNSAFYLSNDKVLMDVPGEWFLDTKARKVYYIPRNGENMAKAEVEVPAVETIFDIHGTPDEVVKDVTIKGITFKQTTWLRPSLQGHAPLQAGMYMTEAYKLRPAIKRPNGDHGLDNQGWVGRPAAAIELNCAENVNIEDCCFTQMASSAIDYHTFTKGGAISNCDFHDIGGNAIMAGSVGSEYYEAHKPYDPSDRRIICDGLTTRNNKITDATNEDWGCVGIFAGYVRNIVIQRNTISEVSYTGISLGWGWNQQPCAMANNKVLDNTIFHYAKHMYDTAGIYTLGAQPHSLIEGNVVKDIYTPGYAHDPNHWFYLYTDEGSSGIIVRNNWTPTEKYLQNSNGPGNTWENNGPQVQIGK